MQALLHHISGLCHHHAEYLGPCFGKPLVPSPGHAFADSDFRLPQPFHAFFTLEVQSISEEGLKGEGREPVPPGAPLRQGVTCCSCFPPSDMMLTGWCWPNHFAPNVPDGLQDDVVVSDPKVGWSRWQSPWPRRYHSGPRRPQHRQIAIMLESDSRVADRGVMRSWWVCTRPPTPEAGSRHIMAGRHVHIEAAAIYLEEVSYHLSWRRCCSGLSRWWSGSIWGPTPDWAVHSCKAGRWSTGALQVLHIVLRELPTARYDPYGQSFFSRDMGWILWWWTGELAQVLSEHKSLSDGTFAEYRQIYRLFSWMNVCLLSLHGAWGISVIGHVLSDPSWNH